jgi:hypothetical protein
MPFPEDRSKVPGNIHRHVMILLLIGFVAVVIAVTFAVPYVILPSMTRSPYEPHMLETESKEVAIDGGRQLAGYVVRSQEDDKGRWVIAFCGNGALAADMLPTLRSLSHALGANVVCFDYRGVGASSTTPAMLRPAQLVSDAVALIEHVVSTRSPSSLVLYGHSLGGMVARAAANVTTHDVAVCSDRSFTNLKAVAEVLFPRWLARLLAWVGYDLDEGRAKPSVRRLTLGCAKDDIIPAAACPDSDVLLEIPKGVSQLNCPLDFCENWEEVQRVMAERLFKTEQKLA